MTVKELVEESSARILRRDAEQILVHVAGRDRAWLLAHPEAQLPPTEASRFRALVSRREAHEPLQYLTGEQEFFGMNLRVTRDVLIPRPETELLVAAVLAWVQEASAAVEVAAGSRRTMRLVDVGTGSGAIALALAGARPDAEIWALDLSDAALKVARSNAERLGLADRIRFLRSDLLTAVLAGEAVPGCLDVVVSNPPYVPASDAPGMQPEVRDFEPHLALFAGEDGLEVYRRLIPEAMRALRSGGLLAMEFGFGQKEALGRLLSGWSDVRFLDDYAGIPRTALAVKPEAAG